jgi:hypothetical protein
MNILEALKNETLKLQRQLGSVHTAIKILGGKNSVGRDRGRAGQRCVTTAWPILHSPLFAAHFRHESFDDERQSLLWNTYRHVPLWQGCGEREHAAAVNSTLWIFG